ncbi:MAG: HD domain-containing protein [Candidatus Omnitrophota bacterium]
MLEAIENSFRSLISALQTAKLYGVEHAEFEKSLDKAFQGLEGIFKERDELVLGIVGDELAFEKEVMFDLSKSIKPMIIFLKSRGIEKMLFSRSLAKEELRQFLIFLAAPKEEAQEQPQVFLESRGVRNISVGKLKESTEKLEAAEAVNYFGLYNSTKDNITRSLDNILEDKEFDSQNVRFNVSALFENLVGGHRELLKLTVVKRQDFTTYTHILNVTILSMFFASKLGLPKDDIQDIGIAALFHDIGKTYIARKIIKKTDKLSEEEFEKIKGHTVIGAEILLRYVDSLGIMPVLAAFEHHLKNNSRGYPKMAFPQKPYLGSAIIEVCDIYDALSSRRSYKAGLSPKTVYDILIKEKDTLPYPQLVDDFFRLMGVWPIGALVVLNDLRVAVVREENQNDIFSPIVEVISPPDNKEIINLEEKKPELIIERFLDPLTEGKPYVQFI